MKYVGEALHEHTLRSQRRIVAIGVASWGIVHNRMEMMKKGVSTINNLLLRPQQIHIYPHFFPMVDQQNSGCYT